MGWLPQKNGGDSDSVLGELSSGETIGLAAAQGEPCLLGETRASAPTSLEE